LNNCTSLLL